MRVHWWLRTIVASVVSGRGCVVASSGGDRGPRNPRRSDRSNVWIAAFDQLGARRCPDRSSGGGFRVVGRARCGSRRPRRCCSPTSRAIRSWRGVPTRASACFANRPDTPATEKFEGTEPGTNGLALDAEGRLVMCCHGDRAIRRLETDGTVTTLADRYQGKRFNSPNDLVFRASGDLYFTDPPYGLPGGLEGTASRTGLVWRVSPDAGWRRRHC